MFRKFKVGQLQLRVLVYLWGVFTVFVICSLILFATFMEKVDNLIEQQDSQNEADGTISYRSSPNLNLYYNNRVGGDRIVEQLNFYMDDDDTSGGEKLKTIHLYNNIFDRTWGPRLPTGRDLFIKEGCLVNACKFSERWGKPEDADVVVFKDKFYSPKLNRSPNQIWIMHLLESPLHTEYFEEEAVFNLTATYRRDADIVTPYGKWANFDPAVRSQPQETDYAHGRSRKVAWIVSNCDAKNNRLEYASQLGKYIEVDVYGKCGHLSCSRRDNQCLEMISRKYKFYLAFENSNCRDYITEKFFSHGLGNNILPIVMGAHPDDYERVAPQNSFIHVDNFSSPKELANYLHKLDSDDTLYNGYFKWKGTGEFIATHTFCRICAMAHYITAGDNASMSYYGDLNHWWNHTNVCTSRDQSWRSIPDIFAEDNYESVSYLHYKS